MSSDFEKPTHDQPVQVGEVVDVVGLICNRNDVGGTTILENPGVECRVEKAFWDYETGWRFHGRVIDEKVVENFRKQATTGFTPSTIRRNIRQTSRFTKMRSKPSGNSILLTCIFRSMILLRITGFHLRHLRVESLAFVSFI